MHLRNRKLAFCNDINGNETSIWIPVLYPYLNVTDCRDPVLKVGCDIPVKEGHSSTFT